LKSSENKKVIIKARGIDLLRNAILNKGTAFSQEEREQLEIDGLLPPHISTMEEQLKRRVKNFQACKDDLAKYNFLTDLQNRNETLFYRFCMDHVRETLPYIYTPVVGEASLNFSLQYHYSRGLYIPFEKKDQIENLLKNIKKEDIQVIVATDGGRILGLGDVGVGGMTIPIGKTSLYTLFGGVHPEKVLPIFLDVGTDNEELLKDPLYLGRRKNRVCEEDYFSFLDAFVDAVKKVFPKALLQWEDLLGIRAQKVLDRYKDSILSFNDDIQGTAGVVLAGLLTALEMKESNFTKEKIAIFGGGAAGLGIGHIINKYLMHIGISKENAADMIHIIDRNGLTYKGQKGLSEEHEFFAKNKPLNTGKVISLEETISLFNITILIGTSAQRNAFSEESMKRLLKNTDMPIVFPLSNPDSKAEATPEMIINTTHGRAIVATGTAFADVVYGGKTFHIGQCNNVYIFPGIGLFTTAFEIDCIPVEFFFVAGETLSKVSPPLLFPRFENLKEASKKIAIEVAKYAVKKKLIKQMSDSEIIKKIEENIWKPEYKNYIE
jgi:malate dehydrogenase (oxaloacetate-decarboxylating)